MKNALLVCVLSGLVLSSCAMLRRDLEEEPQGSDQEETAASANTSEAYESEISRLNTKVSALETKLDVLTTNLERIQMQRSQPVIEAESSPQPNMAAPVTEETEEEEPTQVSAAPVRPVTLPAGIKGSTAPVSNSGAESQFRSAMQLFQSGKNLEASSQFASIARKYPQHLLASHSLYWAGEASARAQQWSVAIENWQELEKKYPRSAYMPEALAGLARAYETQGNIIKAKSYRDTVQRAFPKSPVILTLQSSGGKSTKATKVDFDEESVPAYEESESAGDE